ncbi:MAG: hypothetical protein JXR37_09990 [Kiritimatiellae bacterium]|nr:hypothetical protein [Kiritimatiellia bacterium]
MTASTHRPDTPETASGGEASAIRVSPSNPRYWEYKGENILLLGGSKTDHLFLLEDLEEHLNEIGAAGANYVRNTMSQREARELKPHKLRTDGKFDLTQWNDVYWDRFANMLRWSAQRDIIPQIEGWGPIRLLRRKLGPQPVEPGEQRQLLLRDGWARTDLDTSRMKGHKLRVKWVDAGRASWISETLEDRGATLKLLPPISGICVAVVKAVGSPA